MCMKEFGAIQNWSPISGSSILWDDDAKKVVRVVDTGVPLMKADRNYSAAKTGAARDAGSALGTAPPARTFFLSLALGTSRAWTSVGKWLMR